MVILSKAIYLVCTLSDFTLFWEFIGMLVDTAFFFFHQEADRIAKELIEEEERRKEKTKKNKRKKMVCICILIRI